MWIGSRLSQITVTHEALISCPIVLLAVFMLTLFVSTRRLYWDTSLLTSNTETFYNGNERLLRFSCPHVTAVTWVLQKVRPGLRLQKKLWFQEPITAVMWIKGKTVQKNSFKPTRVSVDSPLLTYTSCESSIDTQLENCNVPKGSTRFSGWFKGVILVVSTEIGDIAGVADVTIRQSYRLIYPRAAELFPPDFKFDTPVDKLPQLWKQRVLTATIFLLFLQDCYLFIFFLLPQFIFVAFYFPPMSLLRLGSRVEALTEIQWTHSNTLQRALQTVTTVTSWVYILLCMCPSGKTVACNFRLVFINFFFSFLFCRKMDLVLFC